MSIISQGFLNNRIASIGYTYILKGAGKGIGPYTSLDGIEIFLDATNTDSYPGTGNTWYDLSGKRRHATLNNGTAFVGSGNTAYFLFDGTDDSASTGGTNFPFYSFEIVFKNHKRTIPNTDMNPFYSIFGMSLDNSNAPSLNIGEWTGADAGETLSLWWKYPTNGNVNTYITDNVDSVFNHLVVNWNGSQYDFYLNGTKRTIYASGNGGHTPFMDAIYDISLGKVIAFNYFFRGNISLFKAWNKPLLASEIVAQYNTKKSYLNFAPRTDRTSLVCHYDFSNTLSYSGSGVTVYDISGYDNNGTLGGTFTYNSSGDKYVALTSGYINIGNPTTMSVSTGDFTAELWVWVNSSNSAYAKLFSKGSYNTGTSYLIQYSAQSNGPYLELYINNAYVPGSPLKAESFNTWRHLVIRRQNGYWDIYSQGTTATPIFYNASDLSNSYNWVIGANNGFGELNNCRIANFKLYQRALSNYEIQQSFSEFKNRFYPDIVRKGLVLLLDAADKNSYPGKGTKWYDLSGNQNHARMVTNGNSLPIFQNNGFYFNGSTSKASFICTSDRNLSNKKELSVYVWCKTINGTGRQYALDTRGAVSLFKGVGIGFDNNGPYKTFNFIDASAGYDESASPTTFQNNTVYQLGISRSYAGTAISVLDTDSVTKISPTLSGNTLTTADINLGPYTIGVYASGYNSGGDNYWWKGEIYLVMMYDRELSQAEITQNFNALRGRFNL